MKKADLIGSGIVSISDYDMEINGVKIAEMLREKLGVEAHEKFAGRVRIEVIMANDGPKFIEEEPKND